MKTTIAMLALTFACGCDDSNAVGHDDGGVDAAADQSVVLEVWCTTSACATSPCTAGCAFQRYDSCPAANPSQVQQSAFSVCTGYCIGYQEDANTTAAGQCLGPYQTSKPGCDDPVCHYDSSCVDVGPTFEENGAAICPPGKGCYNGFPIDDLAPACDI
jgi:hypothetical protein